MQVDGVNYNIGSLKYHKVNSIKHNKYFSTPILSLQKDTVSFGNTFKTNIESYVLPNNLEVIIDTDPDNKEFCAQFELKQARDMQAKPSAKRVLNRMLLNRTLYKEENKSFSPITSVSFSDTTSVLCGKMFSGYNASDINAFVGQIYNPKFTQDEFERAKEEARTDLKESDEIAASKAWRSILSQDDENELKSIDNITLDDVNSYYYWLLNNSKARFAISMPVDMYANAKYAILQNLSALPKFVSKNEPNMQILPKEMKNNTYRSKKLDNIASYKRLYPIYGNNGIKDKAAMEILCEVYKRANPSEKFVPVASYTDMGNGNAVIEFGAFAEEKYAAFHQFYSKMPISDELNSYTINAMQKLTTQPIKKEDLDLIKENVKKSWLESSSRQDSRTEILIQRYNGDDRMFQTYVNEFDGITPQDIQNAAKKCLANKYVEAIEE